jgi:hypothetical protein
MIAQIEEEKKSMAWAHLEGATLVQEEITTQIVDALIDKVLPVKEKGKELAEKFHNLEKVVQRARTT